jgi:hypothetical protein
LGNDKKLRERTRLSEPHLWELQAESYFNRVFAIVETASNQSSEEVTEAVKELYNFITVLSEDIEGESFYRRGIARLEALDWIYIIRTIPDMLHDISAKMDKRDADMERQINKLKGMLEPLEPYLPMLIQFAENRKKEEEEKSKWK